MAPSLRDFRLKVCVHFSSFSCVQFAIKLLYSGTSRSGSVKNLWYFHLLSRQWTKHINSQFFHYLNAFWTKSRKNRILWIRIILAIAFQKSVDDCESVARIRKKIYSVCSVESGNTRLSMFCLKVFSFAVFVTASHLLFAHAIPPPPPQKKKNTPQPYFISPPPHHLFFLY